MEDDRIGAARAAAGPAATGRRIREYRLARGRRQSDLARAVGISPSYLNLIEHGKRRIGGRLLVRLAAELEVEPAALTEGAEAVLLARLGEAAASVPDAGAEIDRSEEFAGRYPGFARLLAARQTRAADLERTITMLEDRIAHDPFLSEALHELLSSVTAIRAASAILTETDDIGADWQRRFQRNIHEDSTRLAEAAERLAAHLDAAETRGDGPAPTPLEAVFAWLDGHGHHFPGIESAGAPAIPPLLDGAPGLAGATARDLAHRHLARHAEAAARLPMDRLGPALQIHGADPGALARALDLDPALVMFRLATLPEPALPEPVGLVIIDGAGAVIHRRALAGFQSPRFGAACPLWPVFEALSRPGSPVSATIAMPGPPAASFRAEAICHARPPIAFEGPPVWEALMLIRPLPAEAQARPVGPTCRICPRRGCPARREPSILSGGF